MYYKGIRSSVPFILLSILLLSFTSCRNNNNIEYSLYADETIKGTEGESGLSEFFDAYEFTSKNKNSINLRLRIYKPDSYEDTRESYPLFLFLHGKGQRGGDNWSQLKDNPTLEKLVYDDTLRMEYPIIILSPQCPEDREWTDKSMIKTLSLLMDAAAQHERIDESRIYLMGSSMGGAGGYSLLSEQQDLFAGAVLICGWTLNDFKPKKLKETSVWIFHSVDDDLVSVEYSRKAVKDVKKIGGLIRYTEYPDGGHVIKGRVTDEPELFPWLFSQVKE